MAAATDQVVVTVNTTPPTADAGADFTKTCTTNPNGSQIGSAPVTGNTYSWSPVTGLSSSTIANPTANPTATTTYTVTVTTTANGCTATDQVVVTVNTTPPTADAGADFTKTCTTNPNGSQIGSAPVTGKAYSWSPVTGEQFNNRKSCSESNGNDCLYGYSNNYGQWLYDY
ncbi:MAG: hypothetical protein IPQ10_01355 [Saprospiraceae bacterium]|nr:hypothetical protein [Saprospiraceae bacterium]